MNQIEHNRHWSASTMLTCIGLLLIIPFAISGRYAVYSSLYQDFVVVALGLMVVLLVTITKSLCKSAPRVSYVLLAMAGYWLLQPLFTDVIYSESNIKASIVFMLFAAVAWSAHSVIDRIQLITVIAWSLLIGASIQALVIVMQAIGIEVTILGVFNVSADNGIQGQLGQRNLLAHYLCWGIVAGSYLSIRGIRDNKFYYLSAVLTILLAVVLGLVGSRSIVLFGIAMTVMALLQILCYRQLTVTSKWLIATSALILIPQVLLPAILSSFDTATQTGLQRVLSSGTDTARGYELKKALLGFMQAPIFGQGWNESTFQAFSRALDIMPLDLHQQEKLPEHSHNIISELLVEMGVVGTLIVVVGTIWALIPAIKTSLKLENVFILALLTITAVHSMVEYPLWNTFFLLAVVLFLTAIPNQRSKVQIGSLLQLPILITSFVSFAIVCFFMVIYQNNYRLYASNASNEEAQYNARANAFYSVFLKLPLFQEDKDKLMVQNIDLMADRLGDNQVAALLRYSEYKPTPQSSQYRGLYEYQIGHREAGLEWLQRSWHFYPSQLGQSLVFIYNAHPNFEGLEANVHYACLRYQSTNFYNNLKSCPPPPSTW